MEIQFTHYQAKFSDDLDLIEDGVAQMMEWLLGMKELEDVTISGLKASLVDTFAAF